MTVNLDDARVSERDYLGNEYHRQNKFSKLSLSLEVAHRFQLGHAEAQSITVQMEHVIETRWAEICDIASLAKVERSMLLGRQFMNGFF